VKRMFWALMQVAAERAAAKYVVGPELPDAIRACRFLETEGFDSTICFWNGDDDAGRDVADRYTATIDAIHLEGLNACVSVKAPPLQFSRELFQGICQRAAQGGVVIRFDSQSPETAEQTYGLIRELHSSYKALGCTLPGRWRRSLADADRAAELQLVVRVVKGQWADTDEPTRDPSTGFLAVIDRLAGRARHVAVATHDPIVARKAIERLNAAGTSAELELLFGLPVRQVIPVANALGVPVRIYVPYGHAWVPYLISQASRNPRVVWRVMRDMIASARTGSAHRLPRKIL
jgi:proline dehydrogenase